MQNRFYQLLACCLFTVSPLLAQPEQESPYQTNEPVEQGAADGGDLTLVIIGIVVVVLIVTLFFLRKKSDRGTSQRLHKY